MSLGSKRQAAIEKLSSGSRFILPVHDKPAKVGHGRVVGRLDPALPGPAGRTVLHRRWLAA